MSDDEKLDRALSIRVNADDVERLDALARRISVATRHAVARAALRLGMDALEEDPTLIISKPVAKRGGARARRRRAR
jgi:hypothetical protein